MNEELIYKFINIENENEYKLILGNSKLFNIIEDSNHRIIESSEEIDTDLYNIDYDILTMVEYLKPVYFNINTHIKLWELIGELYLLGELNEYDEAIKKYILFCKKNKIDYETLKENSGVDIKNIYLIDAIN